MRKLAGPVALIALATACSIDRDDFPDAAADALCDRYRECERADFEDDYADMGECIDDWAAFVDDVLDVEEAFGGEYDADVGRDCISAIRSADCNDLDEALNSSDCDVVQ